jgi:leader peptidase (prepilin peptidase)/N-methyltransferase
VTEVVGGLDRDLLLELPFVVALVALAAIDLDRWLLPNRIVYPLAAWGMAATLLVRHDVVAEHLTAGAGAFLFFLAFALARPGALGMGDVKLAGAMGLYLGVAVIPALLVALLTGAFAGLAIVAHHGWAARRRPLPFGVFLALGGVVGVLAGDDLVAMYVDGLAGGGTVVAAALPE